MKFVGLLSGGKDSCYNIMKCIEYGHELVCLGNLHPPLSSEVEGEMNSYMYQTAGYNMLKYIAICMNKPLITKELSGCAIQQSLDYQETNHDEVEDLYQLLKEIKVETVYNSCIESYLSRKSIQVLKVSPVGQSSQAIKGIEWKMFVKD